METFCASSGANSKFRQNLTNNFYHNVPTCSRTVRSFGSEYALPNCNRRSPPSMAHHNLWQERPPPRGPRSFVGVSDPKPSRGKFCSIALAIASFVVLVVVLAIAGLALYMGALHTETPNALVHFSCSAKVLRGDRFVGALQEKARRYKRQLEALYQRSVLGPALVSCVVEKFGNDTQTIYYKLAFNKRKLTKSISSTEKGIRDILISDAISKKPIFRNIRFDPRTIQVKLVQDIIMETKHQPSAVISQKEKKLTKTGVVLKPINSTVPTIKKPVIKEEPDIKEEDLPVIQGSFKISKTEADITEKKTETTTAKAKQDKFTTTANRKSTLKETSITSALYKIAAVEKVTKIPTITPSTKVLSKTNLTTTTTATTTTTTSSTTSTGGTSTTSPLFVVNPHMFDEEPWIPILPNLSSDAAFTTIPTEPPTIPPITSRNKNQPPVYTSFTNPGLSFNFFNTEPLGSTSLKSHPIPVNKIPVATEPSVFLNTTLQPIQSTTLHAEKPENSSFVEIETVKYIPGSSAGDVKKSNLLLKNISSIFHTLASSLDAEKFNFSSTDLLEAETEQNMGQGQVEVVEGDVEDLMLQTTKQPLVTLLPVKSNSGVSRPLRKRPHRPDTNNLSVENRSFPGFTKANSNEDTAAKPSKTEPAHDDFKIVGVLNFATEGTNLNDQTTDIVRYPKMEPNVNTSINSEEVVVFAINSTVSSTRVDKEKRSNTNVLTPEQIKQLAEISKVHDNDTMFDSEAVISDKAISSNSYTINHAGFKILKKTYNKIDNFAKDENINSKNKIGFTIRHNSTTDCGNFSIRCGDGKCLPATTKCNQLIDCSDGRDEQNCNCADYLRSQYLLRKICDGIVDCWDFTDENQCDWCKPHQYVCGNSKVCIDKTKICDGLRDCPQGDDERQCVTIAASLKAAEEFPYYSEGYLMVRKYGQWGKLCIDNFQNVVSRSHISWEISDLGKAVCKSMTYQNMDSIKTMIETDNNQQHSQYFELAYSFKNETSNLSFKETSCTSKKVVKVKCQSLECGARPQAIKHIARVVGGGNAGLGAWPWQAALYKEGEFQCGATLLSNKWLVSAGHCFYHSLEEHWVARLGALRRGTSLPSPYEQLRPIVRILVHPGYIDSGFINDISLLQMEFPVVFSDYVRPICLPQPGQLPVDGGLCTVVGWGQLFEVGRIFPDTLQEVQVPVISTVECRKRTVFLPLYRITDDMFCAGYERGGRDACLGDSGGPLMCPEPDGRWVLHGITSNGYGCARANRPGVYTKVANYVNWIYSSMNNNEGLGAKNNSKVKSICAGHRCPLGECLPESRLCNGFIECSDGSDEKNC